MRVTVQRFVYLTAQDVPTLIEDGQLYRVSRDDVDVFELGERVLVSPLLVDLWPVWVPEDHTCTDDRYDHYL